jgi:HTH-type transcriptional regulator, sugar sensing transcriptional regulator
MIKEELKKLGFGEKKTALYMALLQVGSGSAASLASTAGIKRTTAYDILEELCRDKLATVTFAGKKRIFTIEPPENLQLIIERQISAVDKVIPGLKELYNRNSKKARIRFYEGTEGLRYVHDELLKVKSKEYFYFGSMLAFEDALGHDYLEYFIHKRIRKRIWSNAIRIRSHELIDPITLAGEENYRRVRYISKALSTKVANLTLFDGKIAISSSSHENYAMIIESSEMFTILKFLWDYIWELAET